MRSPKRVKMEDGAGVTTKEDVEYVAENVEDVEETLEEEEQVKGEREKQQAEASTLADEADMPLEQLLAQYGLSKGQLEDTSAFDAQADGEEEEGGMKPEVDGEWEIGAGDAKRAAKGWYDTLGPFADTYELSSQSIKAYRNNDHAWSLRYTTMPDSGTDYFVRFTYGRELTRKGWKYNVLKISEADASEKLDPESDNEEDDEEEEEEEEEEVVVVVRSASD